MKHLAKRLASFLLAVTLVLGVSPVTGVAAENDVETTEPNEAFYGFIPTPHAGTHALTDTYLRGDGENVNYFNPGQPVADLPAKYDSRDYGYITSVKNQNPYGSCWAHAAMGSIESYMIKHGIPVGTGDAATKNLNLSETQHCFFNFTYAYDAEGMLTGDKTTNVIDSDSPSCLDRGGNGEMSAYTLQRWTGAADEAVPALSYDKASTVAGSGLNSQYAYASNICHVQNSVWIPGSNKDAIKQAIMEYGAGNISYYETGRAYTYICTIDKTSQQSTSHKWANHAITIVGWDDSVSTSKFSPNKPSKNGAWICKNSWGTSNFDKGYCYISYEDTSVLEGYIYFYDAEPVDNYQHNYQYDGTCNLVCFGKGWNNSIEYYEGFANNTQVANVFTAKGAETLEAIAFCSWDENMTYSVEIYKNPETGNPSSGTLVAAKSGNLPFSGYYTIQLDQAVPMAAGEEFSVVITQTVPVADDKGKYVHTPYDATFNNSDVIGWCHWTHADHGATSFYKEPGGSWTDCPENGDYRIKAYTNDVHYNVRAVANNNAWGTLTVEGTKIIAEPAQGYYVADYEVVSGEATATINVNVINVTPSSDCVVWVIFAPKPDFVVTYLASGKYEGKVTAQLYDVITLPVAVGTNVEGWTFSGWTDTQLAEETTQQPNLYLPGADYMVRDNTTLYAVFTRVEGSPELVYRCITSAPENWEGNYVITRGTTTDLEALKAISAGNRYEQANNGSTIAYAATGMTLEDGYLHNAANGYVWQVSATDGGYTIRSKDNGTYLSCKGTNLTSLAAYSAENCTWTLAYDLYNGATKATNTEGGSNTHYPYFSYSTYGGYFVMNSENGYIQAPPQFWRETTISTIYYCTDPIVGEHEHVLCHYDAVQETCTESGNIEYWCCSVCRGCFSDENGENQISADSVVTAALGHKWGEWTKTAEPDCVTTGTETRTCSRCEETENRPVDALGHDYKAEVTEPTCTAGGYTTHTCTRCSDSYTDSETEAMGHRFGEWTEGAAPTCTAAGSELRTCSRCEETESRPVDMLGHDWGEESVTVEPSHRLPGEKKFTCSRCGETNTEEIAPLANPFEDVHADDSFFNPVMWALDEAVTSGVDETHFAPNNTVMRSDSMVFFWAAKGRPAFTSTSKTFRDVKKKHWAYPAVMWAVENGITGGTDAAGLYFSPSRTCTRCEILQFLYAAMDKPEYHIENPYSDVKNSNWYKDGAIWAYENGLEKGENGKFNAMTPCTRAFVVTYLFRFMTGEELAQ